MYLSVVSGNLVDAPEAIEKGVRFKIAQNQKTRDGDDHVHYVSCVNFQTGIKDILLGLTKGEQLTVSGRTTIAQNESNGKTYLNIDVVADNITLPPKKNGAGSGGDSAAAKSDFPFANA